jgi:hypothetical protein
MNFTTQLPMTKRGHDAIVVFVDMLIKMVHVAPTVTTCSTRDVARLFNDTVFKHHGLPSVHGFWIEISVSHLSSAQADLTRLLGTKLKMSTAFHPQTNGQTERSKRILEYYLRWHYFSPTQDD